MKTKNLEKLNRTIGFIEGIAMSFDSKIGCTALWSAIEDLDRIYEEEMSVEPDKTCDSD